MKNKFVSLIAATAALTGYGAGRYVMPANQVENRVLAGTNFSIGGANAILTERQSAVEETDRNLRAQSCLMDKDLVGLSAEGIRALKVEADIESGYPGNTLSANLAVPAQGDAFIYARKWDTSEGGADADTNGRFAIAINDVCIPYAKGDLNRKAAAERIKLLGIGVGRPKYPARKLDGAEAELNWHG